jgi:hypothetical protein
MSCANLQPECFQSFSLENTRFEKAKKEPKKDSALRRFGRDLTELAAQGAARVNAEPLKAEMLKGRGGNIGAVWLPKAELLPLRGSGGRFAA